MQIVVWRIRAVTQELNNISLIILKTSKICMTIKQAYLTYITRDGNMVLYFIPYFLAGKNQCVWLSLPKVCVPSEGTPICC